ncbi:amidohydrolase family protein [Vineibacter terrae]|uniref:Amidohydrolase family protein n=1 Tax=Vineibacter terrae TaxID=2586908 RepID=A0A5C8PI32_9HYPH|nr:amidohydrolase family protein [Vineibacter terrae]TXL73474.1 amidohydrolase family protein [Vineibacter terrae]
MSTDPSLVIRGGTIVDGSGAAPFEGDVAVAGGRIVAVERRIAAKGAEEIDARGKVVAPGFVDIHTHYDGQVTWSNRITPSSLHGVSTVVMGNCGVGFAPCKRTDHELLIRLMEGVEDIPEPVLTAGLPWTWESFADYLGSLEARSYDIDIAAQLPHAALRVYVMGERGANREPATADDRQAMRRLAAQAMRDGALGFATSRTINHRASDGRHIPTLTAEEAELTDIALGLKDAGRGVLQVVSDLRDLEGEFAMLRRLVQQSGRPLSISLAQTDRAPHRWRKTLDLIERASNDGLPIKAQVCGRPVGLLLGFELSRNPFFTHPTYRKLAHLPLKERVVELGKPEVRAAILAEQPADDRDVLMRIGNYDKIFLLGDPPDYEQPPENSLAGIAQRTGRRPEEIAYDALLERDGTGMLYVPFLNYSDGDLEAARAMLTHRDTIPGLGDGGAHCGIICDASFSTYMLTHWARDRRRGERLPIEWVVSAQARETAEAVGLRDRGVLKPGYKADINVIDFDRLTLHAPEVVYDLPTGGRRLTQRAEGYEAAIISGVITQRGGVATGALPGRLVRGAQTA